MKASKMRTILNKMPDTPVTAAVAPTGMAFHWCYKGIGFGEIFLALSSPEKDSATGCLQGKLLIDSELMGREFVKRVICQAIDQAEIDKP